MRTASEKKRFGQACVRVLVSLCLALSVCFGPVAAVAAASPAYAADSAAAVASATAAATQDQALTFEERVELVEESIGKEDSYVADEILVQYENGEVGTVQVDRGESVAEAIVEAEDDPQVEAAQPNYIYSLCDDGLGVSLTGNASDASQPQLSAWHLQMIHAQKAWGLLGGGQQVTVATIDSGCDLSHPYLQDALWKDQAWDVTTGTYLKNSVHTDAMETAVTGGMGHGTHVAGLIAGKVNESVGTAGVFPGAKVLPINVITNTDGQTSTMLLLMAYRKAIQYKDSLNIRVINMSLGGEGKDEALHDEIIAAAKRGVITVGAAGNSGVLTNMYPADFDECISVTSCGSDREPLPSSSYGYMKDLCAPGGSLISTMPGGRYALKTGTSMACPVTSAVAAMVTSIHPEYGVREIKMAILETVQDQDVFASADRRSGLYGLGILDAYAAVAHSPIKVVPVSPQVPKFKSATITKTYGAGSFTNPFNVKEGVTFSSSNTKVLTVSAAGKVTIKGPGIAYVRAKVANQEFKSGTYSYKVKVKPKATKLSSKTKSTAKGKIRVTWKKASGSVTGYQVKYRKAGAKKWAYRTIKGKSKLRRTITKLKSSKSYYVKVRVYKSSNGIKLYSKWSKSKKVKVR